MFCREAGWPGKQEKKEKGRTPASQRWRARVPGSIAVGYLGASFHRLYLFVCVRAALLIEVRHRLAPAAADECVCGGVGVVCVCVLLLLLLLRVVVYRPPPVLCDRGCVRARLRVRVGGCLPLRVVVVVCVCGCVLLLLLLLLHVVRVCCHQTRLIRLC